MSVLSNTGIRAGASGAGAGGYQIAKSLRFDGPDGAKLTRTFAASNKKKWTYSYWIKKCGDTGNHWYNSFLWAGASLSGNLRFDDPNTSQMYGILASGVTFNTTRRFRDYSAWMHVVIVYDSDNSTAGDRFQLYIDGVRETSFTAISSISEGLDSSFNGNEIHGIGWYNSNTGLKCYLADVYFIDGYAKVPGDFAAADEDTGQWLPKEYEDSMAEVTSVIPTGYTYWAGMSETWDGTSTATSAGNDFIDLALPSDTKVYWEVTITNPAVYRQIGFLTGASGTGTSYNDNVRGYYLNGGTSGVFLNQSGGGRTHSSAIGVTFATGHTLMFAWDPINDKIFYGHNGTWLDSADPVAGTNAQITGDDLSSGSWYFKQGRTTHDVGVGTTMTTVSQASSLYYQTVSNKNTCHLKFDGTNLGEDSSGNGNDWTASGLTASGHVNMPCVSFDGSGDYLSIPDSADFTVGSDPFTIEFWAYKTSSGEDNIMGSSDSGGSTASLSYAIQTGSSSPSNSLCAHVGDGSSLHTCNSGVDFVLNRWVHVAFVRDGNTLRLFQNGIQMDTTAFSGTVKDSADSFFIGRGGNFSGTKDFPGYISNFHFVKGTALYTANFTPSTTATKHANTKLLCCQSSSSATEENSDSSHTITATNASATTKSDDTTGDDQVNDTPTSFNDGGNGTGNYATLNPLYITNATITQGNLSITSSSGYAEAHSTQIMTSGKWYMEFNYTKNTGDYITFGIGQSNRVLAPGDGVIHRSEDYGWKAWTDPASWKAMTGGVIGHDGSSTNPLADGDIISLAFDADNGKLWAAKNGTWITNASGVGNPATGANPDYSGLTYSGGYQFQAGPYGDANLTANFGQQAFAYTPPSGFKALNTYNLPDPTIAKPSEHFNTVLYEGTGSSGNAVTGVGFEPDLVWCHRRDTAGGPHLFNSLSGETKVLYPGYTDPEDPFSDFSFDSDGFTASGSANGFNSAAGGSTYASWHWDANTSGSNDASSTGIGTIDSTYKVNTTAGFSIVNYTGNNTNPASVAHGLNAVPAMIIVKNRDTAGKDWIVYHKGIGASNWLQHNTAGAMVANTQAWNGTTPTSTVWTMQDRSDMNNTDDFTAFVWSEVEGYSKFGTYEGNGNVDGPVVWCGFRPAWIMLKNVDDGGNWVILDNKRIGFNEENYASFIPADAAEYSTDPDVDILSNGFKLLTTLGWRNASNKTHIFAAFAESPFKYANAR